MKKTSQSEGSNEIKVKGNYFVKKTNAVTDYFLDRKNERSFYHQTQNLEFLKVPFKMHKNIFGRWVSKMTYYPNPSTLKGRDYDQSTLQKVKNLITQLQSLELELNIFDPKTFLEMFTDEIGILPELESLNFLIQTIIQHYYEYPKKGVVSHNDLIANNFLVLNDEIYLIDFEYASYNHPLFDYASFLTESCNDEQGKAGQEFLNLTPHETQELEKIALYQNYLWAHGAEYMFQKTQKPIYQEIKAQKIAQALKNSKS